MSGGGGKGGSETTKTEIPDWIKQPAIRNLQRAEDVQRIEYMPYYGGDVAAFTPTQNAAFDANIGAGEAFGLLGVGHGLTATSGMPTPTDFDGFTGYSSQPMYESALAELKAKQPGAVAQYDALFGAPAMARLNASRNANRFRGGASPSSPSGSPPRNVPLNMSEADKIMMAGHMDRINDERGHVLVNGQPTGGAGVTEAQQNWKEIQALGGYDAVKDNPRYNFQAHQKAVADIANANQAAYEQAAYAPPSPPPRVVSTAGQGLPWQTQKTTTTSPVKVRSTDPTSHRKDARKAYTGRYG